MFWISLVAFALLSAAAGTGLLLPADVWILHASQSRASADLDALAGIFTVAGTVEYSTAALLALAAGLFLAGRRRLAGGLLAAFLVTGLVELAMKLWLPQTPMPEETARSTDPSPLVEVDYPYPYPSGHMLRSVLLVGSIFVLWPNRLVRTAGVMFLLGMAASRVYLGVHWASDVVGSTLLGVAALAWAFGRFKRGARGRAAAHCAGSPRSGT